MGVWVVQQLMWHTSIVIDNFPHWWVPRPLEPGEVLFAQMPVKSCTVEVVIRKGIIGWMEKKKLNTLSLLLQEWCRLYVLWQNSMVPDLSLPSRTRYSPHGKHLGYLKNVHNSELSNTIFKSVLWTFLPLQMQKVWKTWCFLVGLVTIGQENHKNCMDNLFHFMHLFFKRILWASWQTATFQPVLLGGAAHNFQMCREGKQQRSIRGQVSYSWKCGTKSAMNVQLNTGYLAEACQPACCKGMQSHRNLPSQPSLLLAHTSLLAFHL